MNSSLQAVIPLTRYQFHWHWWASAVLLPHSARRFAAGLVPFVTLFDGVTDGAPTSPFFPLCPVGKATLVKDAILPGMKIGLIPGPREVSVKPLTGIGIQLKTDMKRKQLLYLNSHIDPRVLEGSVVMPERIIPEAILLRKPGEAKYLTAARLIKEKESTEVLVYRWMLLIHPELDPEPGAVFEAAILDKNAAILYPLGMLFDK